MITTTYKMTKSLHGGSAGDLPTASKLTTIRDRLRARPDYHYARRLRLLTIALCLLLGAASANKRVMERLVRLESFNDNHVPATQPRRRLGDISNDILKFIDKKVMIRNCHGQFISAEQQCLECKGDGCDACSQTGTGTFGAREFGSRTQLSLWETFTIEKHPMDGVAIKTHWNKYWKFYNGGEGKKIDCLPDVPKEWEQIDIVKVDGKYAFQSLQHTPANGNPTETFFRSRPDGHCEVSPHRQDWETFQIIIVGGPNSANEKFIGKKVTIRNHHKKYVSAELKCLACNGDGCDACSQTGTGTFGAREKPEVWETFTIEKHEMGGVAIKTHLNKYWKFYNGGDKAKVDCEPDMPDEWERIDIVKVDGGYAFQSLQHTPANGNPTETFFRSWPDGHCDVAPHRQYWETFQINIV